MSTLDSFALIATALGVCIGAWQLHLSMRLAQTTFEDSVDQQYRELAAKIPMDAWLGKETAGEFGNITREAAFQYLDLCNEQVLLRKLGRVSDGRWNGWREGIEHNLRIKVISDVWEEITEEAPGHLSLLERLFREKYVVDPKDWRAGFLSRGFSRITGR